jgi:hypothetical protein
MAEMNNITKLCNVCKQEKELLNFNKKKSGKYGVEARCRDCLKIYNKNYYIKNKDLILLNVKMWGDCNKEKTRLYSRTWVNRNKDKSLKSNEQWRLSNPEKMNKCREIWRNNNEDKVLFYDKNYRDNRKKNELYVFIDRTRKLISGSFKRQGYKKFSKTHEILGCTFEEFKEHIEKQFVDGMSWDNRSKWHIDHIYPISLAKSEEEVIKLNHYTNLQPLWAKDNIRKSNKLNYGKDNNTGGNNGN